MAKVFAVKAGVEIRVGNYGTATDTAGVLVPESLAAELSEISSLRVERDAAPKPKTTIVIEKLIAPETETKP